VAPSIFVQSAKTAGGPESRAHELSFGTPGLFVASKLATMERREDDVSFFADFCVCKLFCGAWRRQYSSNLHKPRVVRKVELTSFNMVPRALTQHQNSRHWSGKKMMYHTVACGKGGGQIFWLGWARGGGQISVPPAVHNTFLSDSTTGGTCITLA